MNDMNGLIDDITAEGWLALCISIMRGVPSDEAFRLLESPTRRNLKWTKEMLAEIDEMREQGMTWNEIAEQYHVNRAAISRSYYRYKGRGKRSYQKHDEEFYLKLDAMRKQGVRWADISNEMGINETRLCTLYSKWKLKKEDQALSEAVKK